MATKSKHIPLEGMLRAIKGKVHVHKTPRCKGPKHDPSCGSAGAEVQCIELPVPGHDNNICVCVHVKV